MLESKKTITLTGSVMVPKKTTVDGVEKTENVKAVDLYASISTETAGSTNSNMTYTDPELYQANLKLCRQDINAFQQLIWDAEDMLLADGAPATE